MNKKDKVCDKDVQQKKVQIGSLEPQQYPDKHNEMKEKGRHTVTEKTEKSERDSSTVVKAFICDLH